jgi:hypothetical protein
VAVGAGGVEGGVAHGAFSIHVGALLELLQHILELAVARAGQELVLVDLRFGGHGFVPSSVQH